LRILITGGAGFIGSHLAEDLYKDHEIHIIDDLSTGDLENLRDIRPHIKTWIYNIAEAPHSVFDLYDEISPDIIIHAAASYDEPDNWRRDIQTNIIGMINLVDKARALEVKKIIYFQTALCYGLNPSPVPVPINAPLVPHGSSYAYSKTAAEQYLSMSGLPYIVFRLASTYGPRNMSGPIPTFYKRISEESPCVISDTRREFVYIDDLVRLVRKAVLSDKTGVYHSSRGTDYSIEEIFEGIGECMERRTHKVFTPRRPDDAATICLDNTKTVQDFEWKPEVDLKEGLKKTVEWYKMHGVRKVVTHLRGFNR